jgi:riboflavin kinase/FMN adenylyltransferase
MKIFHGFDAASGLVNPVVTTGSFDGVHIGHKTILERLKTLSKKYDGESVLITFHPHPRKVLYPDTLGSDLKLLNSQDEKLYLLEKAGLDNIIIVEFTREFSRTTSEEFVRNYLAGILKARVVVVGFNHHFGFNKEGDYRQLWNLRPLYNFEAEEIPEQEVQHETVSSTRIRKAISDGYIQRANAYLDHYYLIMGFTVPELSLSAVTGYSFMRIPVTEDTKLIPPCGTYAVTVVTDSGQVKGMLLINKDLSVLPEVYIHPHERNIPAGEKVMVLFQKRITGNVNLTDSKAARIKLDNALSEISDLIY